MKPIQQTFMTAKELIQIIAQHLEAAKAANQKPLIAIIGPTASGKTALSIKLAKKFNGEIVSADSRQVYREMDIGTGKVTQDEAEGIPHHLIDIVNPDEKFHLVDYKKLAHEAINQILTREKIPFLVGGTGLYLSAIIENYDLPPAPPQQEWRRKLEALAAEKGPEELHKMLQEADPEAAKQIHANNIRYVIRALEIVKTQNKPKEGMKKPPLYQTLILSIEHPREVLYVQIHERIDKMLESGLVEETKTLLEKYPHNHYSMSSLGYGELIKAIEGEWSMEEAIEKFKQHTRNYAKRQLTWFRRYKEVESILGKDLAILGKDLAILGKDLARICEELTEN